MIVLAHIPTPKDYYCRQYFEVLDIIREELSRKFYQKSLALLKAVEQLLLNASQDSDEVAISIPGVHILEALTLLSSNDSCLCFLLIKSYQVSQNLAKLHVISMRTLADVLLAVPFAKEMFSVLDKLLRIYFYHSNYNSNK